MPKDRMPRPVPSMMYEQGQLKSKADISDLKSVRKYIDMVLNKQQLFAPGGKTPEKESVLKKLEEAKAAQTTKKTKTKNHTQEI